MTSKVKRILAIFLAITTFCTTVLISIKSEAGSPVFPIFNPAEETMGEITNVTYDENEIQLHMTAYGEELVLSLAFLSDGIRIYDKDGSNGMFEPKEEEKQSVNITSHAGTTLYAQAADGSVRIFLDYGRLEWELSVYKGQDANPVYTLKASDLMMEYKSSERQTVSFRGNIQEGEEFIGLGERYSGVLLNGKTYELWNKDCWSEGTDSYVNVPLLHSNKGYSLFFNSFYGATADIGEKDSNEFLFEFGGPDFELYLWTGTPLENLQSYARLTGTSAIIPEWAIGYWSGGTSDHYWYVKNEMDENGKTVYHSNLVLEEVLSKYQELGTIPSAVYAESAPKNNASMYTISDNYGVKILGWWHANTPWTKDLNQKFSVKYMKDMLDGASDIPAVKNENGTGYYEEGTNKWVHIDYTHSSAELLLRKNLGEKSNVWSKGLDGFMVDYGEYIPVETTFANGKSGAEMHNLQAYYYNKIMKDAWDSHNPVDEYILFSRAGAAGSQQYAALFGGDQRSTFKGLNQAIQGGISAGASGFSIWGSDIGGHAPASNVAQTEELYLRWLGFATYSPLMRAHGQSMNDPWDYDTEEETSAQDAFKKYYWLRENMRSLIYSSSVQANKDGTPMMQAMGLAFHEEGVFSIQDQYLFCNEILVAPVATEGATSRSVTLPTGKWYDLLTGEKLYGSGKAITVSANQDETPAYLRSGAVVPMEVPSDTWKLAGEMTDSNRAEILLVTPGEKGQARSSTWWKNETDSIQFTSSFDGKTQVIRASEGKKPTTLKMYDTTATHVYVDGVELNEFYNTSVENKIGYVNGEDGHAYLVLSSADWSEIRIETEIIWDYEFSLNQPYEDVSYLDKAFDVYHYEFKDGTKKPVEKVLGPVKPSQIVEGKTVEYFTTQYHGTHSQGYLKPTVPDSGMATLTYKHGTFTNFEAEYEMLTTWSIFGFAFGGEEGVFPVSLDNKPENDTGVVLYMANSGRVDVAGAVMTGTTGESTVGITTYSANSKFSGAANFYTKAMADAIDPVSKPKANAETYTVCIRVEDGWLTVWEKDSPELYARVKLSNTYSGGYVSLIANNTQHGAFKSFRIRSLDNEMTYLMNFDELSSVSEIDDTFTAYHIYHTDGFTRTWDLEGNLSSLSKDFDSYYFEDRNAAATKVAIEKQWFANPNDAPKETYATSKYANDYVKPVRNKTDSSGERYSLLTLKSQKVSDFMAKLTYVTTYSEYGIMVAPARTVGKGSNGLKVYVNSNGKISITGMLDMSQIEWTGEGTPTNTTYTVQTPSQANYNSPDEKASAKYTLIVSVDDGWIRASVDGITGELKVKLKENFVGDHISLYANGYSQGGFDQFDLTVAKGDVVTMSGRPGAYWNNLIWQSGSDLGSDAGYLQPNHRNASDKRFTFLSYLKDTVYDFETEVEIANNHTRYGVSVAPAGEKFTSSNGIGIYVNSKGQINIAGAVDKEKATVSDESSITVGSASVRTNTQLSLPAVSNKGTEGTVYTLCVSHEKGIVTAYVKEVPDVKLSVPTTEAYKGGVLSLYSTGNNQGGFKAWKFNTYKRDTVVWEKCAQGEEMEFILRTDFPYKHVAAIVKYDADIYTYKELKVYEGVTADVRKRAEGELLVFVDAKENGTKFGPWVNIAFETKGDQSGVITANTKVSDAEMNGRYATYEQNICGDIDGNGYFDVRDLVRLKKYSLDASIEVDEINSKLHSVVDIYTDENVFLLRKKLISQ